MNEGDLEGGCACGAVRYRASGAPVFVNNCHCTLCQRQTGAGSAVNAFYESERVSLLSGELATTTVPTGSGGTQEILRCTVCGSFVWSHYPSLGRLGTAVKVGTLDDPGAVALDAVIFTRSKLPWAALPEGVPQFEESYRSRDVLPPDRMERLMVIAARAKAARA